MNLCFGKNILNHFGNQEDSDKYPDTKGKKNSGIYKKPLNIKRNQCVHKAVDRPENGVIIAKEHQHHGTADTGNNHGGRCDDAYQKQLDEAESCIASLEAERDMILENGSGKQEWIEKLKTYKGIKELDRSLITFLIERIDVIDGNTIQVTYRFREEAEELERLAELYSVEIKEAV